jgi:hypothetical protein
MVYRHFTRLFSYVFYWFLLLSFVVSTLTLFNYTHSLFLFQSALVVDK